MRGGGGALLLALLALASCRRSDPPPPRPAPAPAVSPDVPAPERDAGPDVVDAGSARPVVLRVRIKNVDSAPVRILTNPDTNEMIRAHRLTVSPDTSDRAAMFARGARVNLFPIGQMPFCESDAGAGYGGLGQPGSITLQPGESFEAATWDGVTREEVLDPARGVCARESPAAEGRYRVYLDQPQLEGRPPCTRALFRWPLRDDAGVPVLEIQCRNAPRDAGVRAPRASE